MRSAWVTTVWGLDWPGTKIPISGSQTSAINAQKTQFITLINALKSANINAIFFQVRSECDALYPSSFEPWSAHLVADRMGTSTFTVGYDPLQFVVEECHKRGIEVHAWINPYRFESTVGKYSGKPGDYRLTNPEWVLEYPGGGSILDPGNPGVRQRITNIVSEIITNYNVDGVIFDDYFYAYGGTSSTLDLYSQNLYKPGSMSLADWRRDNVNRMVADVYNAIKVIKPWVRFGLSPFGIWTTSQSVATSRGLTLPEGITGMDAYSTIYCDPVAWLSDGTVDYVSPQLYWPTTSVGQDYKKLAPWWSGVSNKYHRHFYSSHSLSGLDASSYAPPADLKSGKIVLPDLQGLSLIEYYSKPLPALKAAPTEWGLQIYWNRISDKNGAPGSVFFRASQFYTTGFINYLKGNEFKFQSLPPAISWKLYQNRTVPVNLRIETGFFKWDSSEDNVRFVVYLIPNDKLGESGNFFKNDYLLGISYQKSFDLSPYSALLSSHTLGVSVIDRYGNEFAPALMGYAPVVNEQAVLVYPANQQQVFQPFSFNWNQINGAEGYIIEVSKDFEFNNVIYRREAVANNFDASNISLIIGETYYWRIRTRKIGVDDVVSQSRSFNLVQQPQPVITAPVNNEINVGTTPKIKWNLFTPGSKYRIQIAPNTAFTGVVHDAGDIQALEYNVPLGVLFTYNTYYVRLMATDGSYSSIWSDPIKFSTINTPPAVPIIISPVQGSSVGGLSVALSYTEDILASGFRVELSTSPSFPVFGGNLKVLNAQALNYQVTFENLINGTWYARARANYGVGLSTAWSPTVSFFVVATNVNDLESRKFSVFCQTRLSNNNVIHLVTHETTFVKLYLTDVSGKIVMMIRNDLFYEGENVETFLTNSLADGIYFLVAESKYGRRTLKLIKDGK